MLFSILCKQNYKVFSANEKKTDNYFLFADNEKHKFTISEEVFKKALHVLPKTSRCFLKFTTKYTGVSRSF